MNLNTICLPDSFLKQTNSYERAPLNVNFSIASIEFGIISYPPTPNLIPNYNLTTVRKLSIRKSTHISFTSMPQLISTTFCSIQFQKTYHRQCNALQSLTLKENVTKIHWLASNIRVIIQNLYTITTGHSIRFLKLQLETRV